MLHALYLLTRQQKKGRGMFRGCRRRSAPACTTPPRENYSFEIQHVAFLSLYTQKGWRGVCLLGVRRISVVIATYIWVLQMYKIVL